METASLFPFPVYLHMQYLQLAIQRNYYEPKFFSFALLLPVTGGTKYFMGNSICFLNTNYSNRLQESSMTVQ